MGRKVAVARTDPMFRVRKIYIIDKSGGMHQDAGNPGVPLDLSPEPWGLFMPSKNIVPQWMKGKTIGELKSVRVSGHLYTYLVLGRDSLPDEVPRYFVGFDKESGLCFISDEVPDPYREFFLRHEIYEMVLFPALFPGDPNRCLRALQWELGKAKSKLEERFGAYVWFRRDFFRTLVEYAESHNYEPGTVAQMRRSLEFLETAAVGH